MPVFVVGGAVRDALLGLPVNDRDWVVVGSTPEAMTAQGFLPVGKDFPVFLHPQTREEYALARTERKTARGYKGFAVQADPGVTLEEDLARRDLTVNAMAVPEALALAAPSAWAAQMVDPYGGAGDLHAKVLRHVTAAFAEDPVRILRVARFAARFADFSVANDTMALMRQMVEGGEVDHLVPERVWQELAKGLMSERPSRMFAVLRECGALRVLLPELDRLWGMPHSAEHRSEHQPEVDTGVHLMRVMDLAARLNTPLSVRVACLLHKLGPSSTPAEGLPCHIGDIGHINEVDRNVQLLQTLCQRLRVPTDIQALAEVVAREHGNIQRCADLDAEAVMRLLERCDALRHAERFALVLQACECDARGRFGLADAPYPPSARLLRAQQAALAVATAPLAQAAAQAGLVGPQIGEHIAKARTQAIALALAEVPGHVREGASS